MQSYLTESNYGSQIIGERIDKCWLDQSFKVSAYEQIDFLKKLDSNQLPFKQSSIDTAKKIMIFKQSPEYTLRGKTGTTDNGVKLMS